MNATSFSLCPSLRPIDTEVRMTRRLRFAVVALTKAGNLPKRALLSTGTARDFQQHAEDLKAELEARNPGTVYAIIDRYKAAFAI
jgi:hypothetical protein